MNMLSLWIVVIMAYNYRANLGIREPRDLRRRGTVAFMIVAGPLSVTEAGSTVMDITYLGLPGHVRVLRGGVRDRADRPYLR